MGSSIRKITVRRKQQAIKNYLQMVGCKELYKYEYKDIDMSMMKRQAITFPLVQYVMNIIKKYRVGRLCIPAGISIEFLHPSWQWLSTACL